MPPKRWTACPYAGPDGPCPTLVARDDPCPTHGRPKNASWSPDRDRAAQHKLRAKVVKARGARCERCGWEALDARGKGLQLHHDRPEDVESAVRLLCGRDGNNCHAAVDRHAR